MSRLLEPLGMGVVESIADDGMRNAAGGIYSTSLQEFALAIQLAFAQQNRLTVRGLNELDTWEDETCKWLPLKPTPEMMDKGAMQIAMNEQRVLMAETKAALVYTAMVRAATGVAK